MVRFATAAAAIALLAGATGIGQAQDMEDMTFFITSEGSGDGANLGGIAGADRICAVSSKNDDEARRPPAVGAPKRVGREVSMR